jgi:quercetin dioxygenase-like cupin family protein
MRVGKLSDMHRGWIIGDFGPSLYQTSHFEVGILTHPKGEKWAAHYHKVGTEFNVLLAGSMRVCDTELVAGDTFIIEPYEVADPVFHEDCTIVCVKIPSDTQDKYFIEG